MCYNDFRTLKGEKNIRFNGLEPSAEYFITTVQSITSKQYIKQAVFKDFPERVRVSAKLDAGLFYAPLEKVLAGLFPYVSVNPANSYNSIVLDLDKDYRCFDYETLPRPNLIVINPKNNHAHLFYVLRNSVHKNPESSGKALKFLADTVEKMTFWTGADLNFTGVLGKNALYDGWAVMVLHQTPWTLATLSDWFDPIPQAKIKARISQARIESRNCALFDVVRHWAYSQFGQYIKKKYTDFLYAVLEMAQIGNNDLSRPMQYSEVRSIAKSIARWTWNNFKGKKEFMAWSKENGIKGAKNSLEKRRMQSEKRAMQAYQLWRYERYTQQQIADALGISRRQVATYLANYKTQPKESPEQLKFAF